MISTLKMQNFKCFFDDTVEFRKLTVLAGENASGKSTVIQALLLVAQCRDSMSYLPVDEDIQFYYLNKGKFVIRALIQLNNEYKLQLGSFKEIINTESKNDRICFVLNEDQDTEYKTEIIEELTHASAFFSLDDIKPLYRVYRKLYGHDFQYINAERIGPRNIQELCTDKVLHVGYSGEYTNHVLLEKYDDAVDEQKLFQKYHNIDSEETYLYKQVQLWLNFLTPGIELFTKKYEEIYKASTTIRRKGFTDEFLNPNNIGFGISYVLPIIVAALSISSDSLLIIENPEAHLHPKAQSRLGEFFGQMASAGTQIVIETHSDHIVNGIRKAILNEAIDAKDTLINFHNADSKGKIEMHSVNIGDDGEVDNWPEGFMDQSRIDLKDMLMSKIKKKN